MLNNDDTPRLLLAFDFGMKSIGVAVGQCLVGSATPLTPLLAKDGLPPWELVRQLIETWAADALVVGLPCHLDGSDQEITLAARKFARRLAARFHCPIYLVDERLTTVEAKMQMRKRHMSASVDSYAAKLILEAWFSGGGVTLK